jgi:ubiquinone/menaquinone biosynthesis C-methylase UbiE
MSRQEIQRYFQNNALEPEGERPIHPHDTAIANFYADQPIGMRKILEISAGKGRVAEIVKSKSPQAVMVGIDFAEAALAVALHKHRLDQAMCFDLTARNIPASDQSMDGVYSMRTSQYFNYMEQQHVLRQVRRVLKQSGWFLSSNLIIADNTASQVIDDMQQSNTHIKSLMTYDQWITLYRQAGFRIDQTKTESSIIPSANTNLSIELFHAKI